MSADTLLSVQKLERHFDGLKAVDGISFSVHRGEVVSIIGPNGSGKTTTLNLVTGAIRPNGGTITLDGSGSSGRTARASPSTASPAPSRTGGCSRRSRSRTTSRSACTRRCARTGRSGGCRTCSCCAGSRCWRSCTSRSSAPRPPAGRAAIDAVVESEIDRFEARLGRRRDDPAYSLSYANRRRTEIARALALEPKLLVLDEPTAGMNQSETAEVLAQLLELKAAGQSILLVEHKLDLVMTVSDRVIVMDGGRIIAEGRPDDVRRDTAVVEAYLGRRRGLGGVDLA
ncbi:ABC transporter ATP-binding protein [Leifsonia shinshuensis]|uniref:ABC transporter ATP-binding protein n=1 Tax=Leifsonia shinshuensis TaxID=150026 RepID=UPI0031E64AE2